MAEKFVYGLGQFFYEKFDETILVALVVFAMCRADNPGQLAHEIATGAFGCLLGFMKGKSSVSKD